MQMREQAPNPANLKSCAAVRISLVVGTLGRATEFRDFLASLPGQPTGHLELIVVDQNPDDRIARILVDSNLPFPVRHLSVPWRGLSRARNYGARHATGEILAFPDDDCSYPAGLLAGVLTWFDENPRIDGLSCRVTDERGRHSAGGFMSSRSGPVTGRNVWWRGVGPGLFVRKSAHEAIRGFDQDLGTGAGTPWGSAEDSDYLLRALASGIRFHYTATRIVHHPRTIQRLPRFGRWWSYGQGMGFVLRRHGYRLPTVIGFAVLSWGAALGSALRLDPGPAVARSAMGAGRFVGWIRSRRLLRQAERTAYRAALETGPR